MSAGVTTNPAAGTTPHPLREAGFIPDGEGGWIASRCDVGLRWDRDRMDWYLDARLPSGRVVRARIRWEWLHLNVEEGGKRA